MKAVSLKVLLLSTLPTPTQLVKLVSSMGARLDHHAAECELTQRAASLAFAEK